MSSKAHVEDQKGTAHSTKDLFLGETLHQWRLQHVNVRTACLSDGAEVQCLWDTWDLQTFCLKSVHQSTVDTTKARQLFDSA